VETPGFFCFIELRFQNLFRQISGHLACRRTKMGQLKTKKERPTTMLTMSSPRPSWGVRPLSRLEAAKQWMKLRIAVRRERLQRKHIAARLQWLREQDPSLYADLRVGLVPLPPARPAVPLLPHVVVAGFFHANNDETSL
jgi:hypothetical protein